MLLLCSPTVHTSPMRTLSFVIGLLLVPTCAMADSHEGVVTETMRAEVVEILSSEVRAVPGTDVTSVYQTLTAHIHDGSAALRVVTVENDYLALEVGDDFYVKRTENVFDGSVYYDVLEPYRLNALVLLFSLFLVVLGLFGGWQGVRGLLSLILSFVFIFVFLLPGIMAGYSPVWVAMGASSVIIVVGSYVTHGLTRTTTSAVLGMIVTIGISGMLATWAIASATLGGTVGDETFYLALNSKGSLDLGGILLGGMLIGLLGVLYDAAIGQAVAVEELFAVGGDVSEREVMKRALRIGKEHIGALVNTLAIAYTGAALPLILLYYSSSEASIWFTLNREIFSTEIVRILVGSIGLILAVPVTTWIAVKMGSWQRQQSLGSARD
jgi:uncharacterized membrane protein